MVKIRLMRIGAKKRPFYRVVAVDERKKRTGAFIEILGTYNPLTEPKEIILKQDRIDDWVKKGAVLSDGYLRMIGKAPQRPPRKPKKEVKEAPKQEPAPVVEPTAQNIEGENKPPAEAPGGEEQPEKEPENTEVVPEENKKENPKEENHEGAG